MSVIANLHDNVVSGIANMTLQHKQHSRRLSFAIFGEPDNFLDTAHEYGFEIFVSCKFSMKSAIRHL